jgi:hypothetical protein
MRLATESILRDIETHLRERKEEEWQPIDKLLLKTQLHILEIKRQLDHLNKMIVWADDITMTGINSAEYEDGFWDAVNYVKTIQSQHGLYGMN